MHRLYAFPDDFEATIRILSAIEGERKFAAFNGIRWDFCYAEDPPAGHLWAIYPDFVDTQGNSLPTDKPLPVGIDLPARMTVLVDERREAVHRQRMAVGTTFYCQDGYRRVAFGRITRITGLFDARVTP